MGLWGTIAKTAAAIGGAPFTGGASLGLLAIPTGGGGEKKSDPLKTDNLQSQLYKQSTDISKTGKAAFDSGVNLQDPGLEFFQRILQGDRNSLAETTAPEANTILHQYDTARRTVLEGVEGRSGNRGAQIAESYFSQASDLTRLLEAIRSNAARELISAGSDRSKTGVSEMAIGQQGIGDLVNQMIEKHGQNMKTVSDIGTGAADIFSHLLWGGKN